MEAYRWSSSAEYLKNRKKRWAWVERLFGKMRIPKDSPAGRRQFGLWMEERRRQETDESEWKPVRRGWRLGDKAFKKELLEQMQESKGDAGKVQMAWRVRQETTMTLKWIAERLKMGTWTYVSNCLGQKRKKNE